VADKWAAQEKEKKEQLMKEMLIRDHVPGRLCVIKEDSDISSDSNDSSDSDSDSDSDDESSDASK
jgi:hypothetical protein